jgi:hypothetical protein
MGAGPNDPPRGEMAKLSPEERAKRREELMKLTPEEREAGRAQRRQQREGAGAATTQ